MSVVNTSNDCYRHSGHPAWCSVGNNHHLLTTAITLYHNPGCIKTQITKIHADLKPHTRPGPTCPDPPDRCLEKHNTTSSFVIHHRDSLQNTARAAQLHQRKQLVQYSLNKPDSWGQLNKCRLHKRCIASHLCCDMHSGGGSWQPVILIMYGLILLWLFCTGTSS